MSTFLSSASLMNNTTSATADAPVGDIRRLKEENSRLREDLAQCQVDKEFVWSLWKKLQVASPDVTEAVALAVEREKEKAELKDQKVLDILRLKDEKILTLQQALERQSQELDFLNRKKLEVQDELARHQTERAKAMDELSDIKRHTEQEKNDLKQRNEELLTTIEELNSTCQKLQEELARSGADVDHLNSRLKSSEEDNRAITDSLKSIQSRLDAVGSKETKLTDLVKRYESQLKKITSELKSKSKELDVARRELSDLWATHHQCEANAQQREAIIRQLESLQQNTEKMLHDCEGAHVKQTDEQHQINIKMQDELSFLRQKELDQEEKIRSLEEILRVMEAAQDDQRPVERSMCNGERDEHWRRHVEHLERNNEDLWQKVQEKNRVIERLSKHPELDYIGDREQLPGKGRVRSKSESGISYNEQELAKKYRLLEGKLEQSELRLQLKESQLEALKQAHQRRLDRLKNLLTSYKLVREQLKVAEDELGRPPKKKRCSIKRPRKKQLQQEDSEAAWNELRYVKNENKNLLVIKMNLEEQVDDMAVKTSEDAANLHSLQIQVDTLQEELRFVRRQGRSALMSSTPKRQLQEDVSQLQAKLASYKSVVDNQQERLALVSRDNTVLVEEKRSLKYEVNSLKKCLHEQQKETADMRHVINRLRRIARRTRVAKREHEETYETPLAQRYDDVLRNSVNNINAAMRSASCSPEPRRDRALEEQKVYVSETDREYRSETMSELGSVEPEPADSAVSLGEIIARRAARFETEDHGCQTSPRLLHSLRSRPVAQPATEASTGKEFRDMGTCTAVRRRPGRLPARRSAFTQVSSLKQRLVSLQMKVKTLTETRDEAKKQAEELVETCDQLNNQINSANTKLISQRTSIQRLETDLNTAHSKILDLESTVDRSIPKQQAEQELRQMELKLRNAMQDLSKRSAELKQSKSDLEKSKDSNTDLSDRISRLERDVAQKRTLLDELRLKLKLAKETANENLQMLESKAEEMERFKSVSTQSKNTIDSLKNSIKALTKEKKSLETKYKESQLELAKKDKQLAACQAQSVALQQEMDSLQETAREQLVNLAAQGENAVGVAQSQLVKAHKLIEQFQLFVKYLSDALLARHEAYRVERQRQVREEKMRERRESKKVESDSLNRAKKRAQEILDLSSADIDDLLNSDTDSDSEESFSNYWRREDSRWVKKWEKALAGENFVKKVADLFIEKIDDIQGMAS